MTQIYVIRHAEVVYPLDNQGRRLMYPPETPISQVGVDQFTAFAEELKKNGHKLDKIFTSPMVRAVQTARILSKVFGITDPIPNEAFTDSYIPGWIGVPLSEQQKLMDRGTDIYENPRSTDQEYYEHIAQRMLEGFQDLLKSHSGKSIALISHGDPIRLLMYRLAHPEGEIPNMSVLSKEGYLKRGEAFYVEISAEGKILKTELMTNLAGGRGKREIYK